MNILRVRHAWPENSGFAIQHKSGRNDYIFIHFHTPVTLRYHGENIKILPDACVVFDKDTELYFKSDTNLIHDWMHFEGDVPELLGRYGLCCDKIYYPKSGEFVTDIIRELEAEYFSKKSYYTEMYDMKLSELFLKLARSSVLDESGEAIPVGTVKNFIDLRIEVFANLSRDWTVGEMARKVMLSESRFFVVYREIFGISPKNDLICARVELAKNILRRGVNTVDEVAERTGYKSTFNFIRQFKKSTGMTPGEFRKGSAR